MSATTPLPATIPDAVTLGQTKEIVGAFGYELVMRPKTAPVVPVGFAVPDGSGS